MLLIPFAYSVVYMPYILAGSLSLPSTVQLQEDLANINRSIISTRNLTSSLVPSLASINASTRAEIQSALSLSADLTASVQIELGLVTPTGFGTTGLLSLISLSAVQEQYHSTKAYLCCTVPAFTSKQWILVTLIGWFCTALAVVCMGPLRIIDMMCPESDVCCSCACLRPFVPFHVSRERRETCALECPGPQQQGT